MVSGNGSPQEYYLYDKKTGNLKKYLGCLLYISEDKKYPLVVGLVNNNYNSTISNPVNYIEIRNIDRDKTYKIPLKKGEIDRSLKKFELLFPEQLFNYEMSIDEKSLILRYHVFENSKEIFKTIKIDLKKYIK